MHLPAAVLTLRRTMEVMTMEGHPVDSRPAHARQPRLDVAALYALVGLVGAWRTNARRWLP